MFQQKLVGCVKQQARGFSDAQNAKKSITVTKNVKEKTGPLTNHIANLSRRKIMNGKKSIKGMN